MKTIMSSLCPIFKKYFKKNKQEKYTNITSYTRNYDLAKIAQIKFNEAIDNWVEKNGCFCCIWGYSIDIHQ